MKAEFLHLGKQHKLALYKTPINLHFNNNVQNKFVLQFLGNTIPERFWIKTKIMSYGGQYLLSNQLIHESYEYQTLNIFQLC